MLIPRENPAGMSKKHPGKLYPEENKKPWLTEGENLQSLQAKVLSREYNNKLGVGKKNDLSMYLDEKKMVMHQKHMIRYNTPYKTKLEQSDR